MRQPPVAPLGKSTSVLRITFISTGSPSRSGHVLNSASSQRDPSGGHPAGWVPPGQTLPHPSSAPAAASAAGARGPARWAASPVPSSSTRALLAWWPRLADKGHGACGCFAAGSGAAPRGCPAPVAVLGSPGLFSTTSGAGLPGRGCSRTPAHASPSHQELSLRLSRPCAAQGPFALQGQVSARPAPAGHPPRRYPRLSAAGALLRSVPAVPVAWGRCCVGPRLCLRWLSPSSSSVYSPEIPI